MSFSKCSNLEAKNATHLNFAIKVIKGRTINFSKQNFENNAF